MEPMFLTSATGSSSQASKIKAEKPKTPGSRRSGKASAINKHKNGWFVFFPCI